MQTSSQTGAAEMSTPDTVGTDHELQRIDAAKNMEESQTEGLVNKCHGLKRAVKEYRNENAALKAKIQEQDVLLQKLQNASKAVCEEYGNLKTRYNVESKATTQILKQATQWYVENQDLKRKSQVLMQKVAATGIMDSHRFGIVDIPVTDEAPQAGDASSDIKDGEAKQLKQIVDGLKEDIVLLKKNARRLEERNRALVKENERMASELESTQAAHKAAQTEIGQYERQFSRLNRVSVLAAKEFFELQKRLQDESEKTHTVQVLAAKLKSERNAAVRQSSVLMNRAGSEKRLEVALNEIQELEGRLETQRMEHQRRVDEFEEKLKTAESEHITIEELKQCLEEADQKVLTATKTHEMLEAKVKELESRIQRMQTENELSSCAPPPPPPPPPPPTPTFNPFKSLMSLISASRKASAPSPPTEKELQMKAMEQMIDEIKKGVHLRPTRHVPEKEELREDEPAVNEVLNILNSIKRKKSQSKEPHTVSTMTGADDELQTIFLRRKLRTQQIEEPADREQPKENENSEHRMGKCVKDGDEQYCLCSS